MFNISAIPQSNICEWMPTGQLRWLGDINNTFGFKLQANLPYLQTLPVEERKRLCQGDRGAFDSVKEQHKNLLVRREKRTNYSSDTVTLHCSFHNRSSFTSWKKICNFCKFGINYC